LTGPTLTRRKVDFDNIDCGSQWRDSISNAIESSDCILVMVNSESSKSEYIKKEIELGKQMGKPIFPIFTGPWSECHLEALDLAGVQAIDFTTVGRWDDSFNKLLKNLQSIGIRVTRHHIVEVDHQLRSAFEHYLRSLKLQIGFVKLGRIAPDPNHTSVELQKIYVSVPINADISLEVTERVNRFETLSFIY